MVDKGRLHSIADIFSLSVSELAEYDRMGEKSAQNVVDAINKARRPTLGRLIFALGIRHVGETTARDLAFHFGSIDAMLDADMDTLQAARDVGPVVAGSIRRFFSETHNRQVLNQLIQQGVAPVAEPAPVASGLTGKTFDAILYT